LDRLALRLSYSILVWNLTWKADFSENNI